MLAMNLIPLRFLIFSTDNQKQTSDQASIRHPQVQLPTGDGDPQPWARPLPNDAADSL